MNQRWFVGALVALASLAAATAHATDTATRPERHVTQTVARPQLAMLRPSMIASPGPFIPTSHPSLDGSPVQELILTSDTMLPAFTRLAAWKTSKGVPTVVRTVSQVLASGVHGSDLAETLRLYIRAAYQDWGVRFVLLGGDTDVIPPRYASADFQGLVDPPTDLYYGCLDGDWNADHDAFFGEAAPSPGEAGDEADLVAEVFVGRAPASTLAEANLLVDKALAYENPSVLDFQNKFLLLAEVLFPVDWAPGQQLSTDGATFAEALRFDVLPPELQTTRLYQNNTVYAGASPLSRQAAKAEIDAGFGTVIHIGHGYRYTLSVGDGSLDVGSAAAFANGPRAGLLYMLNCTAAAYDFESFAETALLNPNGGASLVIGSSREAFPFGAKDYQRAFFAHLYQRHEYHVGEAMARSREEFAGSAELNSVDRWTLFTYTLLGDPETPLWTGTPQILNVTLPAAFAIGSQTVTVTVTDAAGPVRDAVVCATKANEVYAVAHTDSLGHAPLALDPKSAGTVAVVTTAGNHVPRQLSRNVSTVPSKVLVRAGDGLTDDGGTSGTGNSDGRVDAGETVRLLLPLRNAGTQAAGVATATLTAPDADAQIMVGASTYPAIAVGAQANAATAFQVRIPPTTEDGRVVTLRLSVSHDAVIDVHSVDVLVHAARLYLVALRTDDDRAGNSNGTQDPNEEFDLFYRLENRGSGTAEQVGLDLSALDPGLEILTGSAAFAPIPPAGTAESIAPLTVREAAIDVPHRGRLTLRCAQNSLEDVRRIDLRRPATPAKPRFLATNQVDAVHVEWSPSADADLQGYHVERAPVSTGPFARADLDMLRSSYFRDAGLQASRRYSYRVVAVDSSLLVSAPSAADSVSTNPPSLAGWPLTMNNVSASSPAVGDVNADGLPDIVGAAGQLFAWDGHGVELLDADHSPLTWGVFYGQNESFGPVALADLDAVPGKEIVAMTWDAANRYVVAVRRDGTPLPGWPRALAPAPDAYRGSQMGPSIANIDHQGAPEILIAARDGRVYGWHANGTEIADGDANPATQGVLFDTGSPFLRSGPSIADLDPARAGDELVFGGTNGNLYVTDAHGALLPGWPRNYGGYFASNPVIGDLDLDGTLEIVVLEATGHVHALHLNGAELPGFPVGGFVAASQGAVPTPALGNVAGDSKLEIVVCGSDGHARVLDAAGQDVVPGGFSAGASTESSPILGDLDGDPGIEIVLGDENGILHVWNLDGTLVDGFPISFPANVRATPTLADVDHDGDADLVVATFDGVVSTWDLGVPWNAARNPWPTYRGDPHRTGLYAYAVPTPVAVQDLRAETTAEGGVRIRWQASASAGEDPAWRLERAGPFRREPLGSLDDFAYTRRTIGEQRGTGDLEFVDVSVEPGAWYVYVVAWTASPGDNVTYAGPVTVGVTSGTGLLQILPGVANPLRPGSTLRFEIPARLGGFSGAVDLSLYDARGRHVRRLVAGPAIAGLHAVVWDGRNDAGSTVANGVYVVRLRVAGHAVTRKLAWLR